MTKALLGWVCTLCLIGCTGHPAPTVPFVMQPPASEGAGAELDLYLYDVASGLERRLTRTPRYREYDPCLDPQGRQLVYVVAKPKARSTEHELTILDLETGIDRDYTAFTDPILTPVWSNDGERLAYVVLRDGRFQIYTFTINGGEPHQLVGFGSAPSWRQDNRAIFYSSRDTPDAESGSLMVHELGTGLSQSLTLTGNGFNNLPRGTSVVYTTLPYSRHNEAVWLLDANAKTTRLSEPGLAFRDLDPIHVNGTSLVAFTRIDVETGKAAVYVVDRQADDPVAVPLVQGEKTAFTRGGRQLLN